MNEYRWVMCGYDKWWFIKYDSSKSFIGWYDDIVNGLIFYATDNYHNLFPRALTYNDTRHTTISSIDNRKRMQWGYFIKKQRREYPRKMIKDIFQ